MTISPTLEHYISNLPTGARSKLAYYLGVTVATITKYGKPKSHKTKIYPTHEKCRKIEMFSEEFPEYGTITLDRMISKATIEELKKLWENLNG